MRNLLPLLYLLTFITALFSCNNNHALKSQDVNPDNIHRVSTNHIWLSDLGIVADSLIITDTIANINSRRGIYLDSLQIQELIADKIPNEASPIVSSIRLFSVKELSDSLFMCGYVYEYSDIEDIYMFIYKNRSIVDVLKLPIQEESNISSVIDDVEYVDYFESCTEFTDNSHFIVTEIISTKGWHIDGKCVFNTTMSKKSHYTISGDGKIHKGDVIKSQSSM